MQIKDYINENREKMIESFMELLRIPSISADNKFKKDVDRCADWIKNYLQNIGCDEVEKFETEMHPIVYGEKIIDKNLPTILIYGHYDVQPPDPLELWESDPFDPTIRKTDLHPDGAVFARGACDDKGQMLLNLMAIEYLIKHNSLGCNIKFLLEGEEEVGSESLDKFVKENKELLKNDVILISDTAIIANDIPSLTTGLRGLCYFQIELTGPNRDLHSGVYGGGVANPINILSNLISKLQDENNKISIPGFYEDVMEIGEEEKKGIADIPFSEEDFKSDLEIDDIHGEKGFNTYERTSIRPSLDVNGIWGGYNGEGAKTVLPSKAYAKISTRLVPNQDPKKIEKQFIEYLESICPKNVKLKIEVMQGGNPYYLEPSSKGFKAAGRAMEKTFEKKPVSARGGGSIPIVSLFDSELNSKSVLMGYGLDSDNIHSPNEHFGLFNFFKGLETTVQFIDEFAKV